MLNIPYLFSCFLLIFTRLVYVHHSVLNLITMYIVPCECTSKKLSQPAPRHLGQHIAVEEGTQDASLKYSPDKCRIRPQTFHPKNYRDLKFVYLCCLVPVKRSIMDCVVV
jgi:hypothetical protein